MEKTELEKLEIYLNVANKNGGFDTIKDAVLVYSTLMNVKQQFSSLNNKTSNYEVQIKALQEKMDKLITVKTDNKSK